jgi:aldose 1-epimerase
MKIDSGPLVIEHEAMRLTLDAARGGAIREFSWRDRPIFRPAPRGAGADPFDLGCFPMVPYANRIAYGRFSFGGHAVRAPSNRQDEPGCTKAHSRSACPFGTWRRRRCR